MLGVSALRARRGRPPESVAAAVAFRKSRRRMVIIISAAVRAISMIRKSGNRFSLRQTRSVCAEIMLKKDLAYFQILPAFFLAGGLEDGCFRQRLGFLCLRYA